MLVIALLFLIAVLIHQVYTSDSRHSQPSGSVNCVPADKGLVISPIL